VSFLEEKLKPLFPAKEFAADEQGISKLTIDVSELVTVISRLHNELSFESLQTIACADWIEEEHFLLNYILYSYTHNETVFVSVRLNRELKDDGSKRTTSSIPSLETIWPQANQFERELWEMFGISVTGNSSLKEFFLENWQDLPPLRREFDTMQFVNDHFDFRPGREDAMNVAEERKKVKVRKEEEAHG